MTSTPWYLLIVFILASCNRDYSVDLSGGYAFYSESRNDQVIAHKSYRNGDDYIPCQVSHYDFDSNVIIARQTSTVDCFWPDPNRIEHPVGTENYWIILIKENTILGPLSHDDFKLQRIKLSISKKLQL